MSPTSYRTAPPRVTLRNPDVTIAVRIATRSPSACGGSRSASPSSPSALAAGPRARDRPPVVRTADPIERGLKLSDFPRTIKVADNVYTYEDFHAGAEKFTTTNMFVVTNDGVLVADGQGNPAETKGLVDAIREGDAPANQVRRRSAPITATTPPATRRSPPGVTYIIHPTSKAILDARRRGPRRRMEAAGRRDARGRQAIVHAGRPAVRGAVPRPRAHRRRSERVAAARRRSCSSARCS